MGVAVQPISGTVTQGRLPCVDQDLFEKCTYTEERGLQRKHERSDNHEIRPRRCKVRRPGCKRSNNDSVGNRRKPIGARRPSLEVRDFVSDTHALHQASVVQLHAG